MPVGESRSIAGLGELLEIIPFEGEPLAVTADKVTALGPGISCLRFRYRDAPGENEVQTMCVVAFNETGDCAGLDPLQLDLDIFLGPSQAAAAGSNALVGGELYAACRTPAQDLRLQQPKVELPDLLFNIVDALGEGRYSLGDSEVGLQRNGFITTYSGDLSSDQLLHEPATVRRSSTVLSTSRSEPQTSFASERHLTSLRPSLGVHIACGPLGRWVPAAVVEDDPQGLSLLGGSVFSTVGSPGANAPGGSRGRSSDCGACTTEALGPGHITPAHSVSLHLAAPYSRVIRGCVTYSFWSKARDRSGGSGCLMRGATPSTSSSGFLTLRRWPSWPYSCCWRGCSIGY